MIMEAWGFLGLFLAALVVSSHGQELLLSISEPVVDQGGSVTLRCQVTGVGKFIMIHWFKRQEETQVHIATNNLPEADHPIERYTYEVEEGEGDDVYWLLNIEGVDLTDSGQFGCSAPQFTELPTQFVDLTVIKPVEGIRLFAMPGNDSSQNALQEYQDGQTVDFKEKEFYFFKCVAKGSNPAPEMAMTLGDINVTERFGQEDIVSIVPVDGKSLPFHTYEYSSMLTSTGPIKVHVGGNAREFRCSAWVDETEPVSIHIMPSLTFAPVVTCPPVRVPVDTLHLELTCVVRSEPLCDDVEWTFYRDDHSNITLDPVNNPTWNNFKASVRSGDNPDEKVAVLYIEHVFVNHFREYTLTAHTEQGTSQQKIRLERDEEAESAAGGATGLFISLSLLLAALSGSTLYGDL